MLLDQRGRSRVKEICRVRVILRSCEEVTENQGGGREEEGSWYDSMIPWGSRTHSFMRDRSSIWRRITVAARTGLARRLSLLIIAVGLTPRPTRGSPYPRARRVSCLVLDRAANGREQYDNRMSAGKGREKKTRGDPEVDQFLSTLSPYAQKIRQKPFRGGAENEREGDKDLSAAFWTLPPPQILFHPSLKEERDLRNASRRFRGFLPSEDFASIKIAFPSLEFLFILEINNDRRRGFVEDIKKITMLFYFYTRFLRSGYY